MKLSNNWRPVCVLTTGLMILSLVTIGCGHNTAERAVSPDSIGVEGQTRLSGYMDAPYRPGSPSEETPDQVSRSALTNEAELVSLDDGQVCVDLLTRTSVDLDVPLGAYEITINQQPVHPTDETVSIVDYPYTGERSIFRAEGVTSDALARMELTEPEERVFRVYERNAEICGPADHPAEVRLEVVIPQDDRRGHWGQVFRWTLR